MDDEAPRAEASGIWRTALALGLVALAGTALLTGVHQWTRPRIAEQERRVVLQQLQALIPADRYDNELHDDHYDFSAGDGFFPGQTITVYRARLRGAPVAAVLKLAAPDGYNGDIHLLIGINFDGTLTGVRVTAHKETPGLGDALETARSDWILGFDGRSLRNPVPTGWAVKKDGGEFDQFTGATITPRAVVKAVRQAQELFARRRDEMFTHDSDEPQPGEA